VIRVVLTDESCTCALVEWFLLPTADNSTPDMIDGLFSFSETEEPGVYYVNVSFPGFTVLAHSPLYIRLDATPKQQNNDHYLSAIRSPSPSGLLPPGLALMILRFLVLRVVFFPKFPSIT
jgi:hypothetical protein